MIKVNISDYIVDMHIQYIVSESKAFENISLLKTEKFFNEEYLKVIFKETSNTKKYLEIIKNLCDKDEEERELEVILNDEHIKFMDYILENITQLKKYISNNSHKIIDNIFVAKPRELSNLIKSIKHKYKYISTILMIEKHLKLQVSYNSKIIEAIGYNKFSKRDLINIEGKYEAFFKKIYSEQMYNNVIEKLRENGYSIKAGIHSEELLKKVQEKIVEKIQEFKKSNLILSKDEKEILNQIIYDIKSMDLSVNNKSIGKKGFLKKLKNSINLNINKLKNLGSGYMINIENLYNYDRIFGTNWSAYKYVMELKLKVCPYCNRQYITPIFCDEGKVRADLDHFFPKYIYPYLSMSIYNLVPSCKFCNSSLKNGKEFDYDNNLNPFEYGFSNLYTFSYDLIDENGTVNEENLKIIMKDNSKTDEERELVRKAKNNCDIFQIQNIYNFHKEEVCSLLKKKMIYTEKHIQMLMKEYDKLFESREQLINFLIGDYSEDETSYTKKILSKLINDVRSELKSNEELLNSKEINVLKKFIKENE